MTIASLASIIIAYSSITASVRGADANSQGLYLTGCRNYPFFMVFVASVTILAAMVMTQFILWANIIDESGSYRMGIKIEVEPVVSFRCCMTCLFHPHIESVYATSFNESGRLYVAFHHRQCSRLSEITVAVFRGSPFLPECWLC